MRSAIRERNAGDLEDGVGEQAADHADQQVAGQVSGDGLRAVPAHAADSFAAVTVEQVQGARGGLGGLEDHEVGEHEDGDGAGHPGRRAAQEAQGRGAQPGRELADAVLVVLHVLEGVRALEQVPDPAPTGARVPQQLRQLPGEGNALPGERHGEHRGDPGQDGEQQQEHHERRQ
jgi:hypothetical protein